MKGTEKKRPNSVGTQHDQDRKRVLDVQRQLAELRSKGVAVQGKNIQIQHPFKGISFKTNTDR